MKTMKRMICMLLALIMVLGMLPAGFAAAAEAEAPQSITIDFKEFAKEASEQPWWNDLLKVNTKNGYETRRFGTYYGKAMSATELAAYKQMQAYLADGYWNFSTPDWDINRANGQRMYLCADDNIGWGALFNSYYFNTQGRDTLFLDVQAQTEGWYVLNLEVQRQNTDNATVLDIPNDSGQGAGGAYVDVGINGEVVCEDYGTVGFGTASDNLGVVWLEEGKNTVSIRIVANASGYDSVKDYTGEVVVYTSRANVCLRSISFNPLADITVEAGGLKSVDLSAYLPFHLSPDPEIHTLVCKDEDIAAVQLLAGKRAIVEGLQEGETELLLLEDGEQLASIPLTVTASTGEQSAPQAVHVDFKNFAKRAASQSWWQELPVVKTAGGSELRKLGTNQNVEMTAQEKAACEQALAWMKENQNWSINGEKSLLTQAAGNRLYLSAGDDVAWGIAHNGRVGTNDGASDITVDVELSAAGWYSLNMELVHQNDSSKDYPLDERTNPGGGYADFYVNGKCVYSGYKFRDTASNVASVCLGEMFLDEGINTITVRGVGEYNNPVITSYSGRTNISLASIDLLPLGSVSVEEGEQTVLDLAKRYFVLGQTYEDLSVSVADDTVVQAQINAFNELTVCGLEQGSTSLTILCGDTQLGKLRVQVTEQEKQIFDFTKGAELTASGFEAVESYETLPDDGVRSDNWCFESTTGNALYDTEEGAAVLLGGKGASVSFMIETAEGSFLPSLQLYRNGQGGKVGVYVDDLYLGMVDAYASARTASSASLRPVRLEAGDHVLTFCLEANHVNTSGAAALCFRSLTLEEGSSSFVLESGTLSAKPGRTMEVPVSGAWEDGTYDTLYGAELYAEVSHPEILTAEVLPATLTAPAVVQVVASEPVEDAYVTVFAEIGGETAQVNIPVTVKPLSPVVSADVQLEGTVTGQIPRLTTRDFVFTMVGEDGDVVYPEEVDITYEVSDPAVLSVDEQAHTLSALTSGEGEVTVTVRQNDFVFEKTFSLTVGDVGENLLDEQTTSFDEGHNWQGFLAPSDTTWLSAQAADDGTGNQALKLEFNPNAPRKGSSGFEIIVKNGELAPMELGHLYEMSFRVKVDGYKRAEGAMAEPRLSVQLYDFASNAKGSVVYNEVYSSRIVDMAALEDGQWVDLTVPVRAPVSGDGTIYGLPRISCNTHYAYPGDQELTGWEGSVWIDDIEVHEVGFGGVEMTQASELFDTKTSVAVYARPYTTTGEKIRVDAGAVKGNVVYESTDENVVTVVGKVSALTESYVNGEGNTEYASCNVKLVGQNADAQVLAAFTLGDQTRVGALDVRVSGLDDVLRDVYLKLDGHSSLVLPRGETAQSTISGLTTQLNEVTQEQFEGLYFTTSNQNVAEVDPYTGLVTCVGEGTATITGYAMYDGTAVKDTALITVTDDTDLVSMEASAVADYVAIGNMLQLTVSGKKASGSPADMSLYPVVWTLDEESLAAGTASLTEDGLLTGLKEGTVTVTASVGIVRKAVTATMQVQVVDNAVLGGNIMDFDFTNGGILKMETATLEKDGIEINREKTYGGGETIEMNASGFIFDVPVGGQLVMDFVVKKDGWYRAEVRGRSLYYWGCLTGFYVDNTYLGSADFGSDTTSTDKAGGFMGTVWLEAGVHTMIFEAEEARKIMTGRVTFFPVDDPNEVEVTMQAGKTELVSGESTTLELSLWDNNQYENFLHYETAKPSYTNYYLLESSDTNVVKITRDLFTTTLTAVNPGTATITATCEVLGKPVTRQVQITVTEGSIFSAELSAEHTTVAPDAEPFALTLTVSDKTGALEALPEGIAVSYSSAHPAIAQVSEDGIVTITGAEGSGLITATVTEGAHTLQTQLWITVTKGKTEPSLYTNEERAIARENVLKYDWAWQQKEEAVATADYYVEHLEQIYNMWPHEGLPRNVRTALAYDADYAVCQYCKTDLIAAGYGGHYHFLVDPIENPWKVTCPHCKNDFPSNDFGSFYQCGLDERGKFTVERALANGGEQYLVNELYPEMGEGWGVDDGFGYHTGELCANGKERVLTFIAYYTDCMMYTVTAKNGKHSMPVIMNTLADAYLFTGDEKYGSAGAILVDRLADIYPDYDLTLYRANNYSNGDGSSKKGKIAGSIWETVVIQAIARAADVFWPSAENTDVITFLQKYADQKGVAAEDITPQYLRSNAENGILLEAKDAIERNQANGNFGMEQTAMAIAAVALDRLPETQEMIDWIFAASSEGGQYADAWNTGGDVYRVLTELVDRNGFGNEGSVSYNMLWLSNLVDMAGALNGYDRVESANLWEHPKFLNLYGAYIDLTICGRLSPQYHETSGAFQNVPSYATVDSMMPAFLATENVKIAQAIYARNGNSTEGLHGDIFTKDPEYGLRNKIQQIVTEHGEWDMSESAMLTGFGMAILRDGPERYVAGVNDAEFFDYWINFSLTNSHTHHEALNLDLEAFGLTMCGNMGYPNLMSGDSPERNQWNGNTVSNNTVVVDDSCQYSNPEAGFPLHFEDAGRAKVMDISSSDSYDMTDIYRRTVVTVKAPNGVDYAVDFFRVLGGSEHVYSFHGATRIQPTTEGLDLVKQPFGTYAGADVPFGDWDISGTGHGALNTGSGYSWLDDVYRDSDPDTSFTVDWEIEDYHAQLATTAGIHMRMTMLSEKPMTEVALANGQPAQDGRAPDHVEFLLVRNSGDVGLDTLFTAVIEPYQHDAYIASSELVEAELVEGTPDPTDRAAAVKVTLLSGRTDYIVYATNPNCTYEIDGKFVFQGFAGVVSYEDESLVYAWGNEAVRVANVIENAQARVCGTVESFTDELADNYFMTITMDQPISAEELTGRYIYVNNDGLENGAYRIYGAEVTGKTAVLDLGAQDMIRSYVDSFDMDRGYIYNISVGDTYSIPLSAVFDVTSLLNYTTDQVVKTGYQTVLQIGVEGSGATYEAEGLAKGMKFDAATGKITWTPSKTQVGRYPIAVKAVNENGDTLATMEFVIYVVSYTGASYDASVCKHSKAITYTVDGVDETVCPACGLITKTGGEDEPSEPIELIDIAGTNMNLGNELALNFMFPKSLDESKSYTAIITQTSQGKEVKTTEIPSADWASFNNTLY
ncbi:MAG: putative Ig domain-containing protein, partial [Oscillospiraceae bacterium]|nr:putative Ig domain-containing protein [Oscillospiraceae bacterium]